MFLSHVVRSFKGYLANRCHHLIKTFLGWAEKQLADGTLILTSPSGHTYVTTPGSALLFPSLAHAVGGCPAPEVDIPEHYCADRTAMMPKRRRTRAQDRAYRVAVERRHNREARQSVRADRKTWQERYFGPYEPTRDEEPPPF